MRFLENKLTKLGPYRDTFLVKVSSKRLENQRSAKRVTGLRRDRDRLHEDEPEVGKVLVWKVLGFGGHANPLVYARVASFAARTLQGLLFHAPEHSGFGQGRLQVYVDDPALVIRGSLDQQTRAIDMAVLWLMLLGIPLSWDKGSFCTGTAGHTWIGVDFRVVSAGVARLSLPKSFVEQFLPLVQKFCDPKRRTATWKEADELCGKAGRLAQVVPEARPFCAGFYAALAGAKHAKRAGAREAPPSKVATRRFATSARWVLKLLLGEDSAPFPLVHDVRAVPHAFDPKKLRVEFDASTTGGAALLFENDTVSEYWVVAWTEEDARKAGTKIGDSGGQTYWELATLILALCRWAPLYDGLVLCGDNTGSLTLSMDLASTKQERCLLRELAWRKAQGGWIYEVAHIPSESNTVADYLSRLEELTPDERIMPSCLEGAAQVSSPKLCKLWQLK